MTYSSKDCILINASYTFLVALRRTARNVPCMPDCRRNKTCSYWMHWSRSDKRIILQRKLYERTIKKTKVGAIMSFLKAVDLYKKKIKDLTNKNINKNKSVSENYRIKWTAYTPWINIWRHEDLETYKILSKWLIRR